MGVLLVIVMVAVVAGLYRFVDTSVPPDADR
jgi:hypothetical protein